MTTYTTPKLALTLPVSGSGEPFSTSKTNQNFEKIDAFAGTTTTALASGVTATSAVATRTTSLEATRTAYLDATGTTPGLTPGGTTAQRDAYWGVPANATARKDMANRFARWGNEGTGCVEQYRAATGDGAGAGVTSPVAGWYPMYGTLPYAFAYKNASQSVTTEATLTFTSNESLNGITVSNTGTMTVSQGGYYRVWANVRLGGTATAADKVLTITVNGTTSADARLVAAFAATTWDRVVSLTGTLRLAAGDVVRFRGDSNGNAHNATSSGTFAEPSFGLEYIQPRRT